MKKLHLFISVVFSVVCLSSCTEKEFVRFYNYDGTLLWETEYVKNQELIYLGETPVKPTDDMYEYSFSGWNHSLLEVDSYKNFYALYDKDYRSFDVAFKNYDGSNLKKVSVKYGENALDLAPSNPNRINETRTHYYFSGWDSDELSYVTHDITCFATYREVECFKVEYLDYDETTLKIEYIEKGGSSSYTINSYREADDTHYYLFDKWSNAISNVQCDMTVYAQYKIVNAYVVTFKNYDGTILGTTKVPEGFTAEYKGPTPTRPSYTSGNYQYTYTFSGWDKTLTNVVSSFSTTATYSSTTKNIKYETALNNFRNYCTRLDSDGAYKGTIYSGTSSSMYEAVYACYNPSTNVCYLHILMQPNTTVSRTETFIYFPKSNPGSYDVYYRFYSGSTNNSLNLSFSAYATIGSYFSSSTTLTFTQYANYGTTTVSSNASVCSSMIHQALTRASSKTFFDAKALGFNNY